MPQPEAAIAALTAIFENGQEVHRATFPSVNSEGKRKWIMYEMWHAFVSVPGRALKLFTMLSLKHVHGLAALDATGFHTYMTRQLWLIEIKYTLRLAFAESACPFPEPFAGTVLGAGVRN